MSIALGRLRKALSPPELKLWLHLRGNQTGWRFRNQHPISPYILDFYCALARVAVEVDGWIHDTADQARHDRERDAWLTTRGLLVVRYPAGVVLENVEGVIDGLTLILRERSPSGASRHLPRKRGRPQTP